MQEFSPSVQEYMKRAGVSPQGVVSPDARTPNLVDQPIPPSEVGTAGVPSAPKPEFQPQTQDDQIVLTLTEQLERNNKLEKEKIKMASGVMPPAPAGGTPAGPNAMDQVPSQQQTSSPMNQQGGYPF